MRGLIVLERLPQEEHPSRKLTYPSGSKTYNPAVDPQFLSLPWAMVLLAHETGAENVPPRRKTSSRLVMRL